MKTMIEHNQPQPISFLLQAGQGFTLDDSNSADLTQRSEVMASLVL